MTPKKKFDCVEMMHACQVAVRKRLAGLSREEQLAHWRRRHEEALQEQERLLASHAGKRGNE